MKKKGNVFEGDFDLNSVNSKNKTAFNLEINRSDSIITIAYNV
jgi:hypothetical protein